MHVSEQGFRERAGWTWQESGQTGMHAAYQAGSIFCPT